MATLETLTLEIDGNASKASDGITSLISSLSSLGQAVQSSLTGLRELSNVLKEIRTNATGLGSNLGSISSAMSARTATNVGRVSSAMADLNREASEGARNGMQYVAPIQDEIAESTNRATEAIADYTQEVGNTTKVATNAAEGARELAEATKEVGKANNTVRETQRSMNGLFSQIGRIAKTMLLRTAIRSLMKVAKQGLQNFYQYSKSVNGTFYTATQQLQQSSIVAGNQLGAALGTLIASIAPLLNQLLSIVTSVAEALTMLFALLGGQTTYTKAVAGMNSVGKAAGGAGSKIKELLADFDELNVIAQESGGGGGGGGNGFGYDYEEVPLPQWMLDWKPLIEGLLYGGLGALALSKLWKWLKNLLGLGDGIGAKIINAILDKLLGKNKKKKIDIDITGLKEALAQMVLLAAVTELAKKAVEGLSGALTGLMGVLDAVSLIKKLLEMLLLNLLGDKTLKIKVDSKPFDEFKKEFEEWKPEEKKIVLKPDTTMFFEYLKELNHWLQEKSVKIVEFKIDSTEMWKYYNELKPWLEEKSVKTIMFKVDTTNVWDYVKDIKDWLEKKATKFIEFRIDTTKLWDYVNSIKEWLEKKDVKVIQFRVDTTNVWQYVDDIKEWIDTKSEKVIDVLLDDSVFSNSKRAVDDWANEKAIKKIGIDIDVSWANLLRATIAWIIDQGNKLASILSTIKEITRVISSWLSKKMEKTITIDIDDSEYISLKEEIDSWVSIAVNKTIGVNILTAYLGFLVYSTLIDVWAFRRDTKTILIDIATSYNNSFLPYANAIMQWCDTVASKYVTIVIGNLDAFNKFSNELVAWANETLTKTVNVVVNETTNKSTGSGIKNNVATTISNTVNNVMNAVGNVIQTISNAKEKALHDLLTKPYYGPGYNGGGGPSGGHKYYASGGFPDSGELFIARENGLTEMIGNFGGRTGVANNEQIIEGIRQGVADGQSEQNALLRRQNELLQGILEKDASVRIGASAALGRVARQSLDMYSGMVGG